MGKVLTKYSTLLTGRCFKIRLSVLSSLLIALSKLERGITPVSSDQVNETTRFSAKTLQSLRVLCYSIGKELQSNESSKLDVFGFVDQPHTSTADLLDDPVVRDRLADELGGS
jgi:hypothetical protein